MKKRTFTSESQKKDYSQLITNISSICDEISKVVNQVSQRETLQGYFGELILETFSFCELYSLGPEQTTAKSLFKFKSRLEGMKQLAQADGLPDLNLLSSEVMLSYWKKAKNLNPPAIQQSEKNNITDIWEQVVLLENEARAFGFKWTDYRQLIKKIKDECDEAIEVVEGLPYQPERLQEELGDLILATLSFCMYCDFDPKETLEKTLAKKK